MTGRGVLIAALAALAIVWLQQRSEKIPTPEEEETTPIITPSPSPEGENEEQPLPSSEGRVGGVEMEQKTSSQESTTFLVTRVIDGDTIQLADGRKLRYLGLDAPETRDCFAQQASQKNKELVEGQHVSLKKDVSETDRYGRLLRYVYVGNVFVNDVLVREGYALAHPWPPDVAHRDQLRQAQAEAKNKQKGLWLACN